MPHAEIADGVIVVDTRYTEKELLRAIPGSAWDGDVRQWTVPLSWAACLQLRTAFGASLIVGPELALWSQREVAERIGPATAMRTVISRVTHPLAEYDDRLYDFQTAGARFIELCGEGGLLGDQLGIGKTAQALAVIKILTVALPADQVLPALVICPNSVKLTWQDQCELWKIPVTPYPLIGGAVTRRKTLDAAREDPEALVAVNIESVRLLSRLAPYGSLRLARCRECDPRRGEESLTAARCEVHAKPLNGFGFRTVILDEAHRIKDPTAKQTRACWAVGHDPSVLRRWALTGTPIAEHVGDLWSIMHFVAPSEYPARSRSKYVDMYGLRAWNAHGGLDIVGINPTRRDEFYRVLDPRFRRTPKALVLDQLPQIVRPVRWVDMVPKQAKAYAELARRTVTRLDDGQVLVSPNNLVRATRLLQLASSYAEVEWVPQPLTALSECPCYGRGLNAHDSLCFDAFKILVKLAEPSPKLDAVEDDIDALGDRPVVVAAQSRQLIGLLTRRLEKRKVPFGLIAGDVNEYDRRDAIRRLRDGYTRIVLLTVDAGGTGLDGLQVADTMLVIQRSWKMISNVQLDGRVHRIGSERHESVTIVDYVTRGTIEQSTLFPRLQERWERLDEINRDRQRLAEAGMTGSEHTFDLDRRESLVTESFLGTPLTGLAGDDNTTREATPW